MKAKFKSPFKIDGITYPIGVHEVPESMKEHWFFQAQVVNKKIQVLSDEKVKVEVSQEVAQDMIDKGEASVEETKAEKIARIKAEKATLKKAEKQKDE